MVYGSQSLLNYLPLGTVETMFDYKPTPSLAVEFTTIQPKVYTEYLKVIWNVMDCDSTCATCKGYGSTDCLTCASGTPTNGACGPIVALPCITVCATCTTASFCTSCAALPNRVTTPTTDGKCPCKPGFYENASGSCAACPITCSECKLNGTVVICTACAALSNRVTTPTTDGKCPCKSGFYENATGVCVSCPTTCS